MYIDSLLYRLQEVPYHVSDRGASAFADDVILMARTDEGLQQLLDTCTSWRNEITMPWNTANGKSMVLQLPGNTNTSTPFTLAGDVLSVVSSAVYLGMTLNTTGVTPDKHVERVVSIQRRLGSLAGAGLHRNGFDTRSCVGLYPVLVRSIYEYALDLVPLTPQLELAIVKLEATFFKLILEKISSRFGTYRVPMMQALCRLESAELRRVVLATKRLRHYQFCREKALETEMRDGGRQKRVNRACRQLSLYTSHPSITSMRADIENMISIEIEPFRVREWRNACARRARKIPCGTTARYPPNLQLKKPSQRIIGIRWYFNEYHPKPAEARSVVGSEYWRYERLKILLGLDEWTPVKMQEVTKIPNMLEEVLV
ncbi:hypothetical protein FGB62_88g00 [Gracilaria domingensis]|nr:hypothetical protein FGB62_88g00 [Gracilaria domingensis]